MLPVGWLFSRTRKLHRKLEVPEPKVLKQQFIVIKAPAGHIDLNAAPVLVAEAPAPVELAKEEPRSGLFAIFGLLPKPR